VGVVGVDHHCGLGADRLAHPADEFDALLRTVTEDRESGLQFDRPERVGVRLGFGDDRPVGRLGVVGLREVVSGRVRSDRVASTPVEEGRDRFLP
jgi:hypothetical protein